ncbi:GntR family transcriptional regulator [Kibdelosporangium aridum]|uniref:GntR family transcriptional regulator n=2 Tax=Kibdelosporangium aridum TaxID=2030 RepID=A0A428Y998_KIBAR|nr:GntR family transcriptional regulator [Kibdelosporangium aridum]
MYMRIADDIAARITFGDIPPGSVLPNAATLAREYGVSPATATKAIGMLRKWRMVRADATGMRVLSMHE